jgi:benzoate-CoA ligase
MTALLSPRTVPAPSADDAESRDIPPHPPGARFNIAAYLLGRNTRHPERLAYADGKRSLTYGMLTERVQRCAGGLAALGLRREERVLIALLDTVDWPVAFLGAIHGGLVPVAVNTLLTPDDYAYMLEHSRAQAVIVSGALLPALLAAMSRADHEVRALIVAEPEAPLHPAEIEFETFLSRAAPRPAPAPTAADEPAFWLYSSGSTGRPKAVVHTHANPYWTHLLYGAAVLGVGEGDMCFSASKLFFAYGLGNALTFPLAAGASVVLLPDRPTPEAVFARLQGEGGLPKPTLFFGAPTLYAALLAAPRPKAPLALRLASSAGEALPAELGRRFRECFGVDIIDGLGSTEMLHIFLSNRPEDVRYGTTGRPVAGYEVELRDENGRPVGEGEIGDLYVRGPSSALMYWADRARSQETFQGGWTRTGDKYLRHADGTYTYAGRADDMLKVGGVYVSPFEVEATLMQHPGVLEAAVIGITDEEGLMKPMAYVVPRAGASLSAEELKAFVKARLAPYKYPRRIAFVEELPKTATGKIQRFRLREMARGSA